VENALGGSEDVEYVEAVYSSEGLLHGLTRVEFVPVGEEGETEARTTEFSVFYFAGRPVAQVKQLDSTTEWMFLTTDHLGTPLLATNLSGNDHWAGPFEPFGKDFFQLAQSSDVFLRLPGQWDDPIWQNPTAGAGIYYNVHRWFGTTTSGYTRPDPNGELRPGLEGLLQSNNLYSYGAMNPLFYVDPLGLRVKFGEGWLQNRYNQLKRCFPLFRVLTENHFEPDRTTWNIATDPPGDACAQTPGSLGGIKNAVWVPREGPQRGTPRQNCQNTIRCLMHEFTERWLIDVGGHPKSRLGTGSADEMARRLARKIPSDCCPCP
jgi:RHS repeat-associated protein